MLIQLTNLSEEPLHSQITRQITEKVLHGDLEDGAPLPSIREFTRKYHVNVKTVKRAYSDLAEGGLIISAEGKKFVIASLTPEEKQEIAMKRMIESQPSLKMLETFTKQLISVFDPEKLRNILIENLKQHLLIENIFFVIQNTDNQSFSCFPSKDDETMNIAIGPEDYFLDGIRQTYVPTAINAIEFRPKQSSLYETLISNNFQIIVPLNESDQFLGFFAVTHKNNGEGFSAEDMNLLTVLGNQFVTALITARFYIEAVEQRRMKEELTMARQIQLNLLPKELPNDEHYTLAAYSVPSHTVGGDFYDYLALDDDHCGLVIADACGKGLPAAMLISQIQAMLKSEVNHGNCIKSLLENLNKQLVHFTPQDKFVTLFYGVLNRCTGEFEYATAGHNFPIVVRKDGKNEALSSGGLPLGMFDTATYETGTVKLSPGDLIFFYTDGITETTNIYNEEYGEERLQNLLVDAHEEDAQIIINRVISDLTKFGDIESLQDDRTMLILKSNK